MLWKPGYLREGPGIEKDAPSKEGMPLFAEILVREFWQVLKANLFFILFALPLVTLGPAMAGLARSTMRMVQDRPNDVWEAFRAGFRENFGAHMLVGLAQLAVNILLAAGWILALTRGYTLFIGVLALPSLLAGLWQIYLWGLLAATNLPVKEAVRNAFLLGIGCLKQSAAALAACAVIWLPHLLFFPVSLPGVLFLPFGLTSFITSFAAWAAIRKLLAPKERQDT